MSLKHLFFSLFSLTSLISCISLKLSFYSFLLSPKISNFSISLILCFLSHALSLSDVTSTSDTATSAINVKKLFHITLDPGNFLDAATTVDVSDNPTFVFGSGFVSPTSVSAYDIFGQLRWSFYNKSAGNDIKNFEATAARFPGVGAIDVYIKEDDVFNDASFSVFGLSSASDSADPVWTLKFPNCNSQDGGITVKASDTGVRIVVQCTSSTGATIFGVNGQSGKIDWQYNTTNQLSGTDTSAQISSNGKYVLFSDAYSPDSGNNATVLFGETGQVRDSSIPLPYYSTTSAISDSGNYVAVADEIAVNVYKWNTKKNMYELSYVLPPPIGLAVDQLQEIVMSTGSDKDEMIVALYNAVKPSIVAVGIWSLIDATLQSSWSRTGTFGNDLSAYGKYVVVALYDGAVLLKRGVNDEIFNFTADFMFSSSVNVVRSSSGTSDTVFLAVAGGNNGAGGGNTGDAFAYEIDVPDDLSTLSTLSSNVASTPCFGEFNGQPLEEVCFTTLLNSSTTAGLSVREYTRSLSASTKLVSFNVSSLYPDATYDAALTFATFGVIEYFLGGFNKQKKNLLDARTVPFLLLPPTANGYVGRMALAPSKFPSSMSKVPEPLDNVTIVPLDTQPLLLAVQRHVSTTLGPSGSQFAANCEKAVIAIAGGALPGYSIDSTSSFAKGVYAFYYGRDAPQEGPFVTECWLGIVKKGVEM